VSEEAMIRAAEGGAGLFATVVGWFWRRHRKLERRLGQLVTREELGSTLQGISKRLDHHAQEARAAEERAMTYRQDTKETMHRMALHLTVIGAKLNVPAPEGYETNHRG